MSKKKSNEVFVNGEPLESGDVKVVLMDDMEYKASGLEELVELLNTLKAEKINGIAFKSVEIIA